MQWPFCTLYKCANLMTSVPFLTHLDTVSSYTHSQDLVPNQTCATQELNIAYFVKLTPLKIIKSRIYITFCISSKYNNTPNFWFLDIFKQFLSKIVQKSEVVTFLTNICGFHKNGQNLTFY